MVRDHEELGSEIANLLNAVAPGRLELLEGLRQHYADDMRFEDPLQRLEGIDAFMDMNEKLLRHCREISFDVKRWASTDKAIFLSWDMVMQMSRGPRMEVAGVSEITLRGLEAVHHRDYWDLANLLASVFPGGQDALRAIFRPFV